jgi:hypothetical protein
MVVATSKTGNRKVMTPQEKAKILYNSMAGEFIPVTTRLGLPTEFIQPANPYTKQCALIAVDEIIKVAYWESVKDYWQEVKQEIEKL